MVAARDPNTRPAPVILVGVDTSACSAQALRWAIAEADRRSAVVRAVRCIRPGGSHRHPVLDVVADSERADAEQGLRALVDRVVTEAGSDVPVACEVLGTAGRVGDVLVDLAADADLLVVGRRGTGGLGQLLLGSVSRRCAEATICPVVVVPCS
ncbi:universal stress protein [Euzebya sp.]|uniref:universal stress protein n=1 Tax=Euzebya sp. TaxID=1971409 RepID=UPI003512EA60